MSLPTDEDALRGRREDQGLPRSPSREKHPTSPPFDDREAQDEGVETLETSYGSHAHNDEACQRQRASSDDEKERRALGNRWASAEETTLSNRTQQAPPGSDEPAPASSLSGAKDLVASREAAAEAATGLSAPQSSEQINVAPPSRTVEEIAPFQRDSCQGISDGVRFSTAAHQRPIWTPFVTSPGDDATLELPTWRPATAVTSPESVPPEGVAGAECEWYQTATSTAPTPAVLPPHAAFQPRDGGSVFSTALHQQQPSMFSDEPVTSSLHSTPLAPALKPALPAVQAATCSNLATMSSATSPGSRPEKSSDVWSGTTAMVGPLAEASSSGGKADTSTANVSQPEVVSCCVIGTTTVREFTQLTMSWFYSRQQVCGLFCGTGMLFVPLLVVLIILLTRRNPRTHLEYCTSAACTKALASLHTLLDETVDPCHDFHAHVCGRWDSATGGRISYVDESVQRTAGRISRALLDVDWSQTVPRETRLVARFYQLCSSFMVEPNRESLRADMLRPFAGFYDDLLKIQHYPDLLVRLIDLSLAQGVHTVFGVKLVRAGAEPSVVVFPGKTLEQKVRPSLVAPFDEYLRTLVADVAENAGSVPGTFDPHDLMQVDKRVERILTNEGSKNGRRHLDIPMLNTLNEALSSASWLAALNAHLPKSQKLIDNSSVTVDAFPSVQNVLRLFGDLPNHGVNYLYLNVLLDGLRFDYLRTLHNKSDIGILLACLQASAEAVWVTRNVVADLIFGSHGDGGAVTTDLFSVVRESLFTASGSFRWMGNAMQRRTKRSLSTISLRLHDWSDSNASVEASDALLAGMTPADFPATYMRLRKDQQQRFLANTDAKLAADDDLHLFGNKAQFDVEANALIVPASLRVQPLLYPKDVPPEFVAGTLGVLMAKEVHRAVVFNHTAEFWGSRERRAMARFEQCTRVLASTLNVTLTTQSIHLEEPSPYVLWMMAATSAFEALRLASRSFRGASNVAHYWKPAQQTFFRRFCLLTCGTQEDVAEDALTSRLFCLLPTANMPQFAEAFACPANYEEAFCVLE
ncbi:hypothetical protein HPB52_012156 [Rhipicephalus sanguineus]|uniref:Peptidase M13 N-terminal domain-containing protein n=1 Tax=Rhipicephalus sanguineus TaxID=34632 RepID=A0A9D4PZJ8_RHISA|nr:hypothetical protein HPB52_012156 [Rhipicephalus sanguineus]